MNFAGPFDARSLTDSPVSLSGEGFSFGAKPGFVQHHPSDAYIVIPDAHLLFSGTYVRIGNDLIISGADQKFVVGNYFKGETRPSLSSADGATLSGQIVDALTGHVHVAQAGAAPAAAQVIGHVLKMSGSATAVRNGVSIELHIGDAVQKGDVIQTGSDSSIGMTFVDGSAFGMTSNARMVLNEMIYDPNGSSNSSLISLVQGTITFVAGQTAKNGNMRVETPVATMGIRGTAVLVEIAADNGPTKFSVLVEPDGHTGSYNLYDKASGQLIGTVSQAGQVTFVSVGGIGQPPTAIEQLKTLQDQQQEKALIQQVFQLYFPNYNPDNSNPKSQKFGSSSYNNLADIVFTTSTFNQQTFLNQIELRFAVTDPVTGVVTYQNRIFYNTKAVFSADMVTAEQSTVSSVKTFKISDVVHIDDPDIGSQPFYDTATPFVPGSAVIKSAVSSNPNLDANFLSQFLHIDQETGDVSFDRLGFNFLGQGETATFVLQVMSRSGPDSALVLISIIVTGDNDIPNGPPTIVVGPVTVVTGEVKEDASVTPSNTVASNGTITFQDVDLTDTHTVCHEFTSSCSTLPGFVTGQHLGTFTIGLDPENTTDTINTGTVQWHFSLPDDDPVLQSLAEGQTITQVYTITIKDVHGAFVTQDVTITIRGTNDVPVFTLDLAGGVTETSGTPLNSTPLTDSGVITFTDIDLSDTHAVSAIGTFVPANAGDVALGLLTAVRDSDTTNGTGGKITWTYSVDPANVEYLAAGQKVTENFTITIADGTTGGAPITQTIQVVITGTNDAPVIDAIAATLLNEQTNTCPLLASPIHVTFTDVDLTDVGHTATITAVVATGVTAGLALDTDALKALVTPGLVSKLSGDSSGSVDLGFSAPSTAFDYLAAGQTLNLTYTVAINDGDGGTTPATFDITITGTNDAPVVDVVAATSLNEQTDTCPLLASPIHVTFADVDLADAGHTASITAVVATGVTDGLALDTDALKALVTPGPVSKLSGDSCGSVDLGFSAPSTAFDYLAAGQILTLTYIISISDGNGGVTPASFEITVAGTNDAPMVTAVTKSVVDTAAIDTFADQTGTLVGSDVDHGETAGLTYAAFDGTNYVNSAIVGVYGALTVNVDGTYSYVANAAAINALGAGNYVDTFTVQTKDIHGATGTATFQVNVTGANDAPTVGAALTLNTTEGSAPVVKDLLEGAADTDIGDTLSVTNLSYTIDGVAAGSATPPGVLVFPDAGTIKINVDGAHPAFDHLAAGGTQTILVSYDVTDAHDVTVAQTETITVTGANDRPVLGAGQNLATITENDTANSGQLVSSFATAIADADDGAVKGIAITGFTSQQGHWEYSINNGTSWTAFGAYSLSSGLLLTLDDKVRFVPDGDHGGSNTLTYVAWDQTTTATHGQTTSISGGLHSDPFSQGSQTATLTVTDVNDAPVLNVMNHYVVETFDPPGPSATYTSTIHNLIASDVDGGDFESFTLTATAEHGTLSLAGSGSGVVVSNSGTASLTVSGLLGSLNDALAQGVSYTSGLNDANVEQVTAVLTDSHGAFDTVNFIFPQHGSGLSGVVDVHGTAGRDVITSNFGSNNLWGEAGNDVFVFKGMLGNDTIEDFHHGEDLIALAQSGIANFADLLAHTTDVSGNAVIANPLVGSGSITITGVEKAQLAASDFHFVV